MITYNLTRIVEYEDVQSLAKWLDDIRNGDIKDKKKEYLIRICSGGGFLENILFLGDIIENMPVKINTHASGFCCSAALILYLYGEKRTANKNTFFMDHSSSGSGSGDSPSLSVYRERLKGHEYIERFVRELYKSRTLIPEQILNNFTKTSNEWYFDTKTALEYGIVHEIIRQYKTKDSQHG